MDNDLLAHFISLVFPKCQDRGQRCSNNPDGCPDSQWPIAGHPFGQVRIERTFEESSYENQHGDNYCYLPTMLISVLLSEEIRLT